MYTILRYTLIYTSFFLLNGIVSADLPHEEEHQKLPILPKEDLHTTPKEVSSPPLFNDLTSEIQYLKKEIKRLEEKIAQTSDDDEITQYTEALEKLEDALSKAKKNVRKKKRKAASRKQKKRLLPIF